MRSLHRLIALLALACLWAAAPAGADPTFPKFTGLVVDAANVIPDDQEAALTAKLDSFQKRTKRQLVVATVPDLQGNDLATYGYQLGRAWGVGLKGADNGTVLFVAPNEPAGQRGPRIEVGKGIEPVLTDALSNVIINQDMMPKLRAGDIGGAMTSGADAIMAQLSLPDNDAKAKQDAAVAGWNKEHAGRQGSHSGGGGAAIFWAIVVGVILLSMLGGHRRQRWGATRYGGSSWPIILWSLGQAMSNNRRGRDDDWGGGGGWGGSSGGGSGGGGGWTGGGFTGGGGGSFGGGGASGSW